MLLFLFLMVIGKTFGQESDWKKNKIKLKIPLNYQRFFSDRLVGGLQYERVVSQMNSVTIGVSYFRMQYYRSTFAKPANYHPVKEIGSLGQTASYGRISVPGNSEGELYRQLFIWSQWRHYFNPARSSNSSRVFAGLSAGYVRDKFMETAWRTSGPYGYLEKRHSGGIGPLVGFQGVIHQKWVVEFMPSLLYGPLFSEYQYRSEVTQPNGPPAYPIKTRNSFAGVFIMALEVSAGYSF
jgi:hypothetical protein